MAETLLAFLLVTSSAKGPNLVFRWPPNPETTSRLARPLPYQDGLELDNPWRAANHNDSPTITEVAPHRNYSATNFSGAGDYEWKSSSVIRDKSRTFSQNLSLPTSSPPPKDYFSDDDDLEAESVDDDYHRLFDYSTQFLAGMLCPKHALCHQKFELIIDHLAFIGHPVCVEDDGRWRFKPEKASSGSRGRGSTNRASIDDLKSVREVSPSVSHNDNPRLHMFHFVLVLDLPDPFSSASGNVRTKYFDTIYKQIAFTITALLFQQQVLSNFVETECDTIGSLEAEYIAKGLFCFCSANSER